MTTPAACQFETELRGRKGVHQIELGQLLKGAAVKEGAGLLNLFVATRGVWLSANENCDPTVCTDLFAALTRICPASDAPLEVALDMALDCSLTIPTDNGRPVFGTWQGVCIIDGRPRERGEVDLPLKVVVTALPVAARQTIRHTVPSRGSHSIEDLMLGTVGESCQLLHLWARHTSCSLALTSTTEATAAIPAINIEKHMDVLIPVKWNDEFFEHTDEGPDDMPGHAKCTLLSPATTALVDQLRSKRASIQLCEHRESRPSRSLICSEVQGVVRRADIVLMRGDVSRIPTSSDNERVVMFDAAEKIKESLWGVTDLKTLVHIAVRNGSGTATAVTAVKSDKAADAVLADAVDQLFAGVPRSSTEASVAVACVIGSEIILPVRWMVEQLGRVMVVHFSEESAEGVRCPEEICCLTTTLVPGF